MERQLRSGLHPRKTDSASTYPDRSGVAEKKQSTSWICFERSSQAPEQIRHLALRQSKLERVQRHRHHRVVTAQPDHLDDPALGEHLYRLVIQRLRHAFAFMQGLREVVDHL